MMVKTFGTSVALFAAFIAFAQNTSYQPDPGWRAPENFAVRTNPLAHKPEAVAGGKKLFQRHCAECHGESGTGIKRAANFQLPVVQQQPDGVLFWKITNGNPDRGMPSFSRLPELQRWQLVLYLRGLASQIDRSDSHP